VLFASDLIEHDGDDLPDLPLIDRATPRRADRQGQASRHARRTNCISQKLESAQYACRSQRESAREILS
jgi:hypothetical protein